MEVSGQLHSPAALPPGKEHAIPIGQEAGGPQSQSGRGGEEKTIPLAGNQTSVIQSLA
jgi:hypothetical protein